MQHVLGRHIDAWGWRDVSSKQALRWTKDSGPWTNAIEQIAKLWGRQIENRRMTGAHCDTRTRAGEHNKGRTPSRPDVPASMLVRAQKTPGLNGSRLYVTMTNRGREILGSAGNGRGSKK